MACITASAFPEASKATSKLPLGSPFNAILSTDCEISRALVAPIFSATRRGSFLISVIVTVFAPPNLATIRIKQPIGPAPEIKTLAPIKAPTF